MNKIVADVCSITMSKIALHEPHAWSTCLFRNANKVKVHYRKWKFHNDAANNCTSAWSRELQRKRNSTTSHSIYTSRTHIIMHNEVDIYAYQLSILTLRKTAKEKTHFNCNWKHRPVSWLFLNVWSSLHLQPSQHGHRESFSLTETSFYGCRQKLFLSHDYVLAKSK